MVEQRVSTGRRVLIREQCREALLVSVVEVTFEPGHGKQFAGAEAILILVKYRLDRGPRLLVVALLVITRAVFGLRLASERADIRGR